jgi:hypothetical protein
MPVAARRPQEPPLTQAARELWDRWFDQKITSILAALQVFEIDLDVPDDGDDDAVKYGQFNPLPRQRGMLRLIESYFWKRKRRSARIVCLKARRYGMTTLFLLLALVMILRRPGYNVALIAQDDEMAAEHFARIRDFFNQIPKAVLAARGIEVIQDTHQRLVLRHPGNRTSRIRIATAKRRALGRGARNNMLILTEFPAWPTSAKKDLTGILRTCANVIGNIVIFESTAQGYDEFYRRFQRAKQRGASYRSFFVSSYEKPTNRKPFASVEAETAFVKSIGTLPEFGIEDELVLFRKLTVDLRWAPGRAAEYLHWRREEIADECEGVISYFKREEPNTEDEAFQGTGRPLFRKDIVEAWRPDAEKREAQGARAQLALRRDTVVALDALSTELLVLEPPEEGRRYCFGADVASGIEQHADGKTEADFSVVIVGDRAAGKVVARYRAHIPEGEFAEMVFRLAAWYGGAKGYIERQVWGSGLTIDTFEKQELAGYSGMSLLLSQKLEIKSDHASVRANVQWRPGFKTTHTSKTRLIDNIRLFVRDMGLPDGEREATVDLVTLDELMKFERNPRTGKMEAATGHDDCVIAFGLMLEARRHLSEYGGDETEAPLPAGKTEKKQGEKLTGDEILMQYARVRMGNMVEEQDEANPVSGMPGY